MSRLIEVDPATATGGTAELLSTVQSAFGAIPNFAKVMATSLDSSGVFDPSVRLSA